MTKFDLVSLVTVRKWGFSNHRRAKAALIGFFSAIPVASTSGEPSAAGLLMQIGVQCEEAVTTLDGGRVFSGAVFENLWNGRVTLSVDGIPISLALNEDRFSRKRESCSFEASSVQESDWEEFSGRFARAMEPRRQTRLRPITEQHFEYAACTEVEFGTTNLKTKAIYLRKSKKVLFSAVSRRNGDDACE